MPGETPEPQKETAAIRANVAQADHERYNKAAGNAATILLIVMAGLSAVVAGLSEWWVAGLAFALFAMAASKYKMQEPVTAWVFRWKHKRPPTFGESDS